MIASYRPLLVWLQIFVTISVVLFIVYISFFSFGGHLISGSLRSPRGVFIIPALIVSWAFVPNILLSVFAGVRLMLFENRRAVWIEQGILIYLRKGQFSARCADITRVIAGTIDRGAREGVIVNLCDGSDKSFPTGSLTESNEAIVARLNAVLALSS